MNEIQAANEREQTMRLELEREQASARELQTQISDGRQREEKLKAQNAALPTHSTEGTPSKIRSRKRVDSTGVSVVIFRFPVMRSSLSLIPLPWDKWVIARDWLFGCCALTDSLRVMIQPWSKINVPRKKRNGKDSLKKE